MARRWTREEERRYKKELINLYVAQNKTIGEIAPLLGLKESSVFDRMQRLGIKSNKQLKTKYLNRRTDIVIPKRSPKLAEFFGAMFGDGHVSHYQTSVTLGTKELAYVKYVQKMMQDLFGVPATICIRKSGYRDVYIGSTQITSWLLGQGLVHNKVGSQVDVPTWIYTRRAYMKSFIRGFFDTDGSVYKLRFGTQISLTNKSMPLLKSLRKMLITLGYKASEISSYRVYLTRKDDLSRFFREIRPANTKHLRRFADY
jgi:intein/homing endonuclease